MVGAMLLIMREYRRDICFISRMRCLATVRRARRVRRVRKEEREEGRG